MFNLLDYIPVELYNPYRDDVKYLLRKRIFHPGWQLSYCYLPAHEDIWLWLVNVATKQDALEIINNSHR